MVCQRERAVNVASGLARISATILLQCLSLSSSRFLSLVASAVLASRLCLDENGCAQFNNLLFRRGTPRFCAFDLLWLNGRDLRNLKLIERKREFRKLVPNGFPHVLHVDYIEMEGERLFELACGRDLEGIVAKDRQSRYTLEDSNPAWVKIRNRRYSQMMGVMNYLSASTKKKAHLNSAGTFVRGLPLQQRNNARTPQ